LCQGEDTNLFYNKYEQDPAIARVIDEECLSCPVLAQCLRAGTENGEYGVWGGIYLVSGKPDEAKNDHKTPEVWQAIKERVSGAVL
jgi:hypothetical protein